MIRGHWFGNVETEALLQMLGELKEEARSIYERDFKGEFQELIRKISEIEEMHQADYGNVKEGITKIDRKLDGKLFELSQSASDIQTRAEQREGLRLELEKQKVRLQKIQLVLSVILAFLTGLLIPYLAQLLGLLPKP